ncbi:hypothetical protein clem_05170 [Legionella clemsonensis]|uniref:Uncharacterized protein n=1 Tax=Legionella clemsonensis TaxID=1867846 RepID=A0A222P179_9GAMM|nr:hypothetical protein clem_05170 [Legionella clemsonensis]
MKHLANNALRTKNMIELLQAMSLNLDNTQINCMDERVVLRHQPPKKLRVWQKICKYFFRKKFSKTSHHTDNACRINC